MHVRCVLLFLGLMTGCLTSGVCLAQKIPVLASVFPVADLVRQVGGQHVDVTVVIPAGASPHVFEPKPSLVRQFSSARLYFMIGAGLESWSSRFIGALERPPQIVVLSEGVALIRDMFHRYAAAGGQGPADRGHATEKGADSSAEAANPHIWLDPVIAVEMVKKILAALVQTDAAHRDAYERNGRRFITELEKLDRLIADTVNGFSIKKYVAFHPAWDYFARRYGLVAVGIIETAPGRNPTPQRVKQIVQDIRRYHIRAVFAEPQLNPKVAHVIAKEAGVRVLLLDPMGGDQIKGRDSYTGLIHYNLGILEEAMR